MMSIKHVNTEVKGEQKNATIRMRFADAPDAEAARAFVEMHVPFDNLLEIEVPQPVPGNYPDTRLQIAALRYVRDALSAEILRLSRSGNR